MDRSYDEVSCIGNLVESLTSQLTDSAEHISKLQRIALELVKLSDYDVLSNNQQEVTLDEIETDQQIIQRLEDERLQLVMELQRQDYVSTKVVELMDQNRDIIDSVKDFLTARDKDGRYADDEENADDSNLKRVELYINHIVKPTETQLRSNIDDLDSSINQVNDLITLFTTRSSEATAQLESPEYKEKVSTLVGSLNKVYNRRAVVTFLKEQFDPAAVNEIAEAEGTVQANTPAETEKTVKATTLVESEESGIMPNQRDLVDPNSVAI